VYYLPTEMSPLQKDMSEAVVHFFSSALLTELLPQRDRSNINSLLLAPGDTVNRGYGLDSHTREKTISLIYNQLLTICMHPSLVVDHFISKGLLLLSTKSRLSSLSGKIMLFDRMVDLISEKYELQSPATDYNLLVVAKSIKELELIEGSIIGKKLRYRNVNSGKCLYEENSKPARPEKDELPDDEQTTEYKHRHQHFTARHAGSSRALPKEFVLHLITSNYLCLSFTSDTSYNLIVSFDSDLDVSSPGIELLRSTAKPESDVNGSAQSQIPILIPTPVFSVEHLSKVVPKPEIELGSLSTDTDSQWRCHIIRSFVANRHFIFEDCPENIYSINYGKTLGSLDDLLFRWQENEPTSAYKWLLKYSKKLETETSSLELKARLDKNHLSALNNIFGGNSDAWGSSSQLKLEDADIKTYDGFKKQMARFLNTRLAQTEKLKTEAILRIIPQLREQETQRQNEIDIDEEHVGENYRKLRKLNDEMIAVDRRFNRVENENQKLQESVTEAQQMLEHLQDILQNRSDDEINKVMTEQKSLLEQLEKEKCTLSSESQTLVNEIDVCREEYQEKSTLAILVTERLQKLKEKHALHRSKAEGPGMLILPSLSRKDEIENHELHLRRLTEENAFINELFTLRFDKLVKERNLMVDTTAPVSGSRQTHRISRAPTPL
ncbi:hypothetical protein METBIDRAFT_19857, partial [Metschnikowia bicuspidata var. bicuspidata NRRL YB-4993]